MKILFDHQIFVSQKNGGISRFFCNLIDHLKQEENTEVLLPIVEHENEYLKEFTNIVNPKIAPSKIQKFLKKDQNFAAINSFFESGNGDAAIYFDAKDNLAIKASVENIISDSDLRKKMCAKGLERNKLFTWQNVARQTRELYESIV
jgi:hypothetical protein